MRPELVRRSVRLPAEKTAPRRARAFVRALGGDWSLDRRVVEDAALVATELVANAVVHARSCSVLTAERTADRLGIAVRDHTRHRRPRLHPSDEVAGPARGLNIVGRLVQDWGVTEHWDSKVVWANLGAVVRRV
jgi:anti-sigma regulatory factor (Ser/Thr protein kinase)